MSAHTRTPSDELEERVRQATRRLKTIEKYKNKKKLPASVVAAEAGISRGVMYSHTRKNEANEKIQPLLLLCQGIEPDKGTPLLTEVGNLTATEKELLRLRNRLDEYDQLLKVMEDTFEFTTKKIFDNYVSVYRALRDKKGAGDSSALRKEIVRLKNELENTVEQLEQERILNRGVSKSTLIDNDVTSPFVRTHHVSPDKFLSDKYGRSYDWTKEKSRKAWLEAKKDLWSLLAEHGAQENIFVYFMSGLPNSGKTSWIRSYKPSISGVHIFFDAVFSEADKRGDMAYEVKDRCPKAKTICVYVRASLETCLERQLERQRTGDKHIRPDIIQSAHDSFEPVTVDEPFDEIIIVRIDDVSVD